MIWHPKVHLAGIGCFLIAIHSIAATANFQERVATVDQRETAPITALADNLPTFVSTWQHKSGSQPILPVFDHTIATRRNMTSLVGGFTKELTTSPTIQIHHAHKGWLPIGSHLFDARARHSQSALSDGRVLIVGGVQGKIGEQLTPLASCEVVDPFVAGSMFVEPLDEPLVGHTAHNLEDGRVAIVGGNAVHIFDGDSLQWVDRIPLLHRRVAHVSLLLNHDTLLIVGGDEQGTIEQVDLTSRPTQSNTIAVVEASESNEEELVGNVLAIEEPLLVPELNMEDITVSMDEEESDPAIDLMPSDAPVSSGLDVLEQSHAELETTIVADAPEVQVDLKPDVSIQQVEVLAGRTPRTIIWDARLPHPLIDSAAIQLNDGRIWLAGGFDTKKNMTVDSTWFLDPKSQRIKDGPELQLERGVASAGIALDPQGRVAIVGGEWRQDGQRGNANAARLYDVTANRLWALPSLPTDASRRIWSICPSTNRLVGRCGYSFISRDQGDRTTSQLGLYLSTDEIILNMQPLPPMLD